MITQRPVLGILGGMGPLSSAEFLCTLYECAADGRAEQDMPLALLLSDSTFPPRTADSREESWAALRDRVEAGVQRLIAWGCDEIVLCCFTAHHVVPQLSPTSAGRLRSLLDATVAELLAATRPCLVLCSTATRMLGLLETHPSWPAVRALVRFPDDADQERVNAMIKEVKSRGASAALVSELDLLVARYCVENAVFACTELHMLNRAFEKQRLATAYLRRDPLYSLARAVCARTTPRQS
ncbi:MAG TPA: aspartate/glutamate racemase family protein [Kofleriaceae bacterium]|nr:aspartate/glutamate racemase family protein [Kofleriaceae bacterium]